MGQRKTILVVDDGEVSRGILKIGLQDEFNVMEAENGEAALRLLMAVNNSVDAIVLDLVMPVMDGFQFLKCRNKDEALAGIPVIVVTANNEAENEIRALEYGADDLIGKPFDRKVLVKRLYNIIEMSKAQQLYKENLILQENRVMKEQLQAVLNGITGGIFRIEIPIGAGWEGCKVLFANRAFYEVRGIEDSSRHDIRMIKTGLSEEDFNAARRVIIKSIDTKTRSLEWNYAITEREGVVRYIHSVCGIEYGEKTIVLNVIETDITEQVVSKLDNERVAHQLQSLVNNIPGGIILFEADDRLKTLYFNDGTCKFLGYTREEYQNLTNDNMENLIHPDDLYEFKRKLSSAVSEGRELIETYRILKKNGKYKWITMHANLIEDYNGKQIFYGMYSDVDKLKEQAEKDSLTGLCNRATYETYVDMFFKGNYKNNRMASLFMLDIDNFKLVNDHFGHDFGDKILIEAGEKIKEIFREEDIVARLGGDEFSIFMMHKVPMEIIELRAKQLCQSLARTLRDENCNQDVNISCSVGIAIAPVHGNSFVELYRKADQAQYFAKKNGKNGFCIFQEDMKVSSGDK